MNFQNIEKVKEAVLSAIRTEPTRGTFLGRLDNWLSRGSGSPLSEWGLC